MQVGPGPLPTASRARAWAWALPFPKGVLAKFHMPYIIIIVDELADLYGVPLSDIALARRLGLQLAATPTRRTRGFAHRSGFSVYHFCLKTPFRSRFHDLALLTMGGSVTMASVVGNCPTFTTRVPTSSDSSTKIERS